MNNEFELTKPLENWILRVTKSELVVDLKRNNDLDKPKDIFFISIKKDNEIKELVLKVYNNTLWLRREPYIPRNEAKVLSFLAEERIRSPKFLGLYKGNTPTLLMSKLKGQPYFNSNLSQRELTLAADYLFKIHSLDVSKYVKKLNPYRPHYFDFQEYITIPKWTRKKIEWKKAIEIYFSRTDFSGRHLVHRDYHPGNILYHENNISGIVDWATSCAGNPLADLGHMRFNLFLDQGKYQAEFFSESYLNKAGLDYNYIWDLRSCVGAIPDFDIETDTKKEKFDEFICQTLEKMV